MKPKRSAILLKLIFPLAALICFILISSISLGFDDLALEKAVHFINVESGDVIRSLAAYGKLKIVFGKPLQQRMTLTVKKGAFVKKTITDLAAQNGLAVKWLPDSISAVIDTSQVLINLNLTDLKLQDYSLRYIPSISVAKILETVIPRERIKYDLKLNRISVMANSLELQNITEIIHNLDQDIPLVRMELTVMETDAGFWNKLGISDFNPVGMKVYSLTGPQTERIMKQNVPGAETGQCFLAKQEVISLNQQRENIFFGDKIPVVIEENTNNAINYQIQYVNVGNTINYYTEISHGAHYDLMVQVQAITEWMNSASNKTTPAPSQREIVATVGLVPGQSLLISGLLSRSEYRKLNFILYEYPILSALYKDTVSQPISPELSADTVIILTPWLHEKIVDDSGQYMDVSNGEKSGRGVHLITSNQSVTMVQYMVRPKDTVFGIARKYRIQVSSIIGANHLKEPGYIQIGSTLILLIPNQRIYTVKTQDTLWRLARKYKTTVETLHDLNGIPRVEYIQVGQKLIFPRDVW